MQIFINLQTTLFPRFAKTIRAKENSYILVTNIDNKQESKDYLKTIEEFVMKNPQGYDAIIDFGSRYLFGLIRDNTTESLGK